MMKALRVRVAATLSNMSVRRLPLPREWAVEDSCHASSPFILYMLVDRQSFVEFLFEEVLDGKTEELRVLQ
jgi:hypothetical protein